jgi:hypothetical protein
MAAKAGSTCNTGWIDATGAGPLETVLQQGCCPFAMWQSPAIFLQHSISECVICGLGRQASAGELIQTQIRASPMMCWNLAIPLIVPTFLMPVKSPLVFAD